MKLSNKIWMDFGDGGAPHIPTGYTVHLGELPDGQEVIVARAPEDKRKSQGRVPKTPALFFLMTNDAGKSFWVPEKDYGTRHIREFMIAQGLQLEIRMPGFQMTAKAPKCSTILRQEYGMKGTPAKLLKEWLEFRQIEMDKVPAHKELR